MNEGFLLCSKACTVLEISNPFDLPYVDTFNKQCNCDEVYERIIIRNDNIFEFAKSNRIRKPVFCHKCKAKYSL